MKRKRRKKKPVPNKMKKKFQITYRKYRGELKKHRIKNRKRIYRSAFWVANINWQEEFKKVRPK